MTAEQARVLVIDDDPGLRELLQLCLEDEGYAVAVSINGRDGLDRLQRWRPRVILLDLMMPVMDGWTFRAEQLARDDLARIPVVVLSAAHQARRQAEMLGAAAIIEKPFDLDSLCATVTTLAEPSS